MAEEGAGDEAEGGEGAGAAASSGAAKYGNLVREMCKAMGIPDAETVIARGCFEVEGYEVLVAHYSNDEQAMYLNFSFGITTAGRTQRVFELLLQSNLSIYSMDQALLGVHPDTGGLLLVVRVPMTDDVDAQYLADTFRHYVEHGRYWKENIFNTADEEFEAQQPPQQ